MIQLSLKKKKLTEETRKKEADAGQQQQSAPPGERGYTYSVKMDSHWILETKKEKKNDRNIYWV